MTRYYLEIVTQVTGMSRDEMEKKFEPLADAVYDLAKVIDADLGADFAVRTFHFSMAVDADDEVSALQEGMAAVRCAVHAAGGSTPGWEKHFESIKQVVRTEKGLVDA